MLSIKISLPVIEKFNESPSASVATIAPIDSRFSATVKVSDSMTGALSLTLVILTVTTFVVCFSPSDAVALKV